MTHITPEIPEVPDFKLPVRVIRPLGKDAVGAIAAPPNPYDELLDPDAMHTGSVEDAAVRPVEKPKDDVTAWVERSVGATQNALKESGGTETQHFNVPPKQ